jgi:hypothetical protein
MPVLNLLPHFRWHGRSDSEFSGWSLEMAQVNVTEQSARLSAVVCGPVTWSVMDAERLTAVLREFREGVERIYGQRLVRLVLFGSQARNDAKPDSDIDVMVVLRGAVRDGEEIERTSFPAG